MVTAKFPTTADFLMQIWCEEQIPTSAGMSSPNPVTAGRISDHCGIVSGTRHDSQIMTTLFFDQFDSQVGVIGILAGPAGVREVGWRLLPEGASIEPDEIVQMALGQLREYFAGQRREFTLPLDLPPMEPVAKAVLEALRTVGYGKTITYGELAALSGTGVPARAIGEIMAANPVPIIIPCHRVVASDGLGGYSGGDPGRHLETKRWLLENEGALPPALV